MDFHSAGILKNPTKNRSGEYSEHLRKGLSQNSCPGMRDFEIPIRTVFKITQAYSSMKWQGKNVIYLHN